MTAARDIEIMRDTWGSRVDPLREQGAVAFNTRAVIDASGTWTGPNPVGGDGLPAAGEADAPSPSAARRRTGTDGAAIAVGASPRPSAPSSRPGTDDLMASTIS
jgi:hypothetical protein